MGSSASAKFRAWHFAALWLVLAFGLVAWEHRFYFVEEHWEVGDAAANALQIRQAKYLNELHGNYSRFGFHHPGPGFFYAYAAGEWVLYDLLKVVPSPYNAHVLVGVLLQTGFLAWALAIVAMHVGRPSVVALCLVFAALHFGAVNYNQPHSMYESIWPPHVLLFPFLCFVVASASLAAGNGAHILPAVVSGCMLVHGHVAQPLFVGPLFVISCVAFVWRHRSAGEPLGRLLSSLRRPLIAAGAVLLLFLLPLAIDATAGAQSNIARVLEHFTGSSGDRKSLLQSLNYLGNFLCYVPDPEKFCNVLGPGSLIYARDRWYLVVGWLVVAALLFLAFRRPRDAFSRWLLTHFGIAIVLVLCWGIAQTGEMFAFNSHFAYALLFVPMILVAIAASRVLAPNVSRVATPVALAAAVPLFVASSYDWKVWPPLSPGPSFEQLVRVAKSESRRKKFLTFPGHDWPWAVGAALALRRLGMDYRVRSEWGIMFGKSKTANFPRIVQSNHYAIWEFGADPATRTGFQLLGGPFVATLPARLAPNSEITFAGDPLNAGTWAHGWDLTPGGPFSYSVERMAVLYFQPDSSAGDVEMTIDAFPATFGPLVYQRMVVTINGQRLEPAGGDERAELTYIIPAAVWNGVPSITVGFEFPNAASPASVGVSADQRRLGYGFRRISFRELPSP